MPASGPRGCPSLLLVPTELEADELARLGGFEPGLALEAQTGLGPFAAAARTASLLERLQPARVLLLGIAGTYDAASLAVGSAVRIGRVAIDGLETAGFEQAPGIGTILELAPDHEAGLLTVLSPAESIRRRKSVAHGTPGAVAEDMEGFGVALACAIGRVPLAIVRGISNVAGDRNTWSWRISGALGAARALAIELLRGPGAWTPPR